LAAIMALYFAAVSTLVPGPLGHPQREMDSRLVWSVLVLGGVLLASSFLAIEFFYIRRTARMEKEFQVAGGGREGPPRRLRGGSENQEALLLSVLDGASEGIMAFRSLRNEKGAISDFVMVIANRAAGAMMGRKPREMLGKCLLGLFPGDLSEGLFEKYVRVAETKAGEHLEVFRGHEGVRGWVHISVDPWSDGFVMTIEEIGGRKRAEQELKANIEEMERFNRAMIGRENRVLEMKSEVNLLRSRLGLPPAYKVDSSSDEP